ncbi:hypothetical protein J4225_00885 [Candidatus Pacearchaeota archaeon]|nr:hypothetical protein [Candidatus Pacearchaeota archaeon]
MDITKRLEEALSTTAHLISIELDRLANIASIYEAELFSVPPNSRELSCLSERYELLKQIAGKDIDTSKYDEIINREKKRLDEIYS